MLYIYGPVLSFALLCPVIWDALAIYGPVLRFVFICGLFGFVGRNYVESDKGPHFFRFWPFALFYALLCPLALLYMPVCLHWLCLGGYIALYGLHWLIYGLYIWHWLYFIDCCLCFVLLPIFI